MILSLVNVSRASCLRNVVCASHERRAGFNITLGHLTIGPVSARIDCDPPRECPPTTAVYTQAPTPVCAAGVAAHAFALADRNLDFKLDIIEVERAAVMVREHLGQGCGELANPSTCFGTASRDERLTRAKYFDTYMPCLIHGLGERCSARVCND